MSDRSKNGGRGLERVQQKWEPALRPDTRQNRDLEQDDGSKKRHLALTSRTVDQVIGKANSRARVQEILSAMAAAPTAQRQRQALGRRGQDGREQPPHVALGETNRGDANDVETSLKIASKSESVFADDEWQPELEP